MVCHLQLKADYDLNDNHEYQLQFLVRVLLFLKNAFEELEKDM